MSKEASSIINVGFHVFILFFFLTILFFVFISQKEKDAVSSELNDVIENQIPVILKEIDETDKHFDPTGKGQIPWDKIDIIADKMKRKISGDDEKMNSHNKNLKIISGVILVTILGGLILLIIYFTKYKKYKIQLGHILLENFIIFAVVGIIEVTFFLLIALKYVPVTSTDMLNSVIDRLKYRINKDIPL